MPTNDSFQGVSNCYMFKSRLQEYAQKVGVRTPVYQTVKEGPSHEPYFRSSVVVSDVTYNSLTGFLNRKAAEQSAAEVALVELVKSGDVHQTISLPVHETGLCKNLLQEYAQKMNYAIPLYQCQAEEAAGRTASYQCTIEIGGTRYIGASAKTKKEAEIKAARTALLAIQSSAAKSGDESVETTQLTVLPCKKRPAEPVAAKPEQTPRKAKAKKKPLNGVISRGFKKKMSQARNRNYAAKSDQLVDLDCSKPTGPESTPNSQNGTSQLETERFSVEAHSVCHISEPASGSLDQVSGGPTGLLSKDINGGVSDVRDSDVNVEKSTNGIAAMVELLKTGSALTTNMISSSE